MLGEEGEELRAQLATAQQRGVAVPGGQADSMRVLVAENEKLRREVEALDPDMMRRAILDMRNRARLCIAKNGGHFEK